MKKIVLSTIALSLTLMAYEAPAKLQADITAAKAEQAAAEKKVKALEAQLPQNQDIKTHMQLGYINTDGNTDTETLSLDGSFKKAWGNNSGSIIFDSQYGKASDVKTAEKYFVELEYAYLFTDNLSFTYIVGYKDDTFSSYDYQAYTGPGAKYKTYKSEKQELNIEGSILYAKDESVISPAPADFEDSYAAYKAKLTYEWKIVDDLKFNQEVSYRSSFSETTNYFVFSESKLTSKISDIFSAGLSYKVDYSNIVAPTFERSDNTLSAFLSLDY